MKRSVVTLLLFLTFSQSSYSMTGTKGEEKRAGVPAAATPAPAKTARTIRSWAATPYGPKEGPSASTNAKSRDDIERLLFPGSYEEQSSLDEDQKYYSGKRSWRYSRERPYKQYPVKFSLDADQPHPLYNRFFYNNNYNKIYSPGFEFMRHVFYNKLICRGNRYCECYTKIPASFWVHESQEELKTIMHAHGNAQAQKRTAMVIDIRPTEYVPKSGSVTCTSALHVEAKNPEKLRDFLTLYARVYNLATFIEHPYRRAYAGTHENPYTYEPFAQYRYIQNVLRWNRPEDVHFYVGVQRQQDGTRMNRGYYDPPSLISFGEPGKTYGIFYMVLYYHRDMTIALHKISPGDDVGDTSLLQEIFADAKKAGFVRAITFAVENDLKWFESFGFRDIDGRNAYSVYTNLDKQKSYEPRAVKQDAPIPLSRPQPVLKTRTVRPVAARTDDSKRTTAAAAPAAPTVPADPADPEDPIIDDIYNDMGSLINNFTHLSVEDNLPMDEKYTKDILRLLFPVPAVFDPQEPNIYFSVNPDQKQPLFNRFFCLGNNVPGKDFITDRFYNQQKIPATFWVHVSQEKLMDRLWRLFYGKSLSHMDGLENRRRTAMQLYLDGKTPDSCYKEICNPLLARCEARRKEQQAIYKARVAEDEKIREEQDAKQEAEINSKLSDTEREARRIEKAEAEAERAAEYAKMLERLAKLEAEGPKEFIRRFGTGKEEIDAFLALFKKAYDGEIGFFMREILKKPHNNVFMAAYKEIPQPQEIYINDIIRHHRSENVRLYASYGTFYVVLYYREDMTIALHEIQASYGEADGEPDVIKRILDDAREAGFRKAITFVLHHDVYKFEELGFKDIDGRDAYTLYTNRPYTVDVEANGRVEVRTWA